MTSLLTVLSRLPISCILQKKKKSTHTGMSFKTLYDIIYDYMFISCLSPTHTHSFMSAVPNCLHSHITLYSPLPFLLDIFLPGIFFSHPWPTSFFIVNLLLSSSIEYFSSVRTSLTLPCGVSSVCVPLCGRYHVCTLSSPSIWKNDWHILGAQ